MLEKFIQKQTSNSVSINKDQMPLFKKSKGEIADAIYDKETKTPRVCCLSRSCDQCGAHKVISQYENILKEVEDEKIWYFWEYITIQKNGKSKRVTS